MEGSASMTPSAQDIEAWIVDRINFLTGVPAGEVDVNAPLTRHGIDSVALIALAADLEQWLGYRFRENPLSAHSTIASLASFLADEVSRPKASK